MKVKELIERLKKCNPEASVVGTTNDHCYNKQCDFYDNGFAYVGKYGEWAEFEEEDTTQKIPIVQFEFY